jgi:hypothetical protein
MHDHNSCMSPLQLVPQGSYWLVYMTRFGGILPAAYWLASGLIRDYGTDLGDTLQKIDEFILVHNIVIDTVVSPFLRFSPEHS